LRRLLLVHPVAKRLLTARRVSTENEVCGGDHTDLPRDRAKGSAAVFPKDEWKKKPTIRGEGL